MSNNQNLNPLANLELKDFQERTIEEMLKQTDLLLENASSENTKILTLKSPTGSGKTIMLAEFLKRLHDIEDGNYVIVWLSVNDLHTQSLKKVSKIVGNRYDIKTIDDLTAEPLAKHTILFSNWHSLTRKNKEGKWANVHVRKGEQKNDLGSVVDSTKAKVILFVDESHRQYKAKQSQEFVDEILKPIMVVEISATPDTKITEAQIQNREAARVEVSYQDAIREELLKKETIISPDLDKYSEENPNVDINTLLLQMAYDKREELLNAYKAEGVNVNPLILIQLPDDIKNGVKDEEDKLIQRVKDFYKDKGITDSYGDKLGVWLDREKSNLEDIEVNDNTVEALIFKTAIATGWDCPRASILVMFRHMESTTLKIQTVGRVLRMPEAKHYKNEILNKAYLYTQMESIEVYKEPDEPEYYSTTANLRTGVVPVVLPSVISHSPNQITLTRKFEDILFEKLKAFFHIDEDKDDIATIYNKIDVNPSSPIDGGLEVKITELQKTVIANVSFVHPDAQESLKLLEEQVGKIDINESNENIENIYNRLMRAWAAPYIRNEGPRKLSDTLHDFFDLAGKRSMTVRYLTCSEINQQTIGKIVDEAKAEFKQWWEKERGKYSKVTKDVNFVMSNHRPFTFTFEVNDEVKKYAYSPCRLPKNQSTPEIDFQKKLEADENIIWWFKNNDSGSEALGIPYEYSGVLASDENGTLEIEQKIFYPDYVVMFKNGTIGIYETKSDKDGGIDKAVKAKSDALQNWLEERRNEGLAIEGGIVEAGNGKTFKTFKSKDYSSSENNSGWVDFDDMIEQEVGSLNSPYKSLDLYNIYDKPDGYRPIIDPRNIL